MLLAITSNGKIGLGVLAGLLIVFAILSAFYFPRRNPDFPGNRLGLFILVSVVLFAGTMVGVVVFAAEEGEPHSEEATQPQGGEEPPASTEQATTGTSEAAGDAAAGEAVFASAGCVSLSHAQGGGGVGNRRAEPRRGKARRRSRRRPGDEREGRDAVVQGAARREADPGRCGLRRRVHARLAPRAPRIPCARPERCPSGRRSATGNRVSVERRFAGSNPALSVDQRLRHAGSLVSFSPVAPERSLR